MSKEAHVTNGILMLERLQPPCTRSQFRPPAHRESKSLCLLGDFFSRERKQPAIKMILAETHWTPAGVVMVSSCCGCAVGTS
jgi:hypothetical protein